jgi:hypothetical protein
MNYDERLEILVARLYIYTYTIKRLEKAIHYILKKGEISECTRQYLMETLRELDTDTKKMVI